VYLVFSYSLEEGPVRQIEHPMSRAIYEFDEDFNVRVTARDGRTGTFDPEGRYLHGSLRHADPELCRWIGLGPRERQDISQNRRFMDAAKVVEEYQARAASPRTADGAT
jgi:hypothetical protein